MNFVIFVDPTQIVWMFLPTLKWIAHSGSDAGEISCEEQKTERGAPQKQGNLGKVPMSLIPLEPIDQT